LRSIRSFSRGRTRDRERGFVLISALILAVLYFGLMELMLIDASRALAEANRFRARAVANVLAENAVELASAQMITRTMAVVNTQNDQGTMSGKLNEPSPGTFTLTGSGTAAGIAPATASVEIDGRFDVVTNKIYIDYSRHSL
jgi:hypothetical protein